MDLEQIKQILDLVREHELSEFEIEHDGPFRLKVRKRRHGSGLLGRASGVGGSFRWGHKCRGGGTPAVPAARGRRPDIVGGRRRR